MCNLPFLYLMSDFVRIFAVAVRHRECAQFHALRRSLARNGDKRLGFDALARAYQYHLFDRKTGVLCERAHLGQPLRPVDQKQFAARLEHRRGGAHYALKSSAALMPCRRALALSRLAAALFEVGRIADDGVDASRAEHARHILDVALDGDDLAFEFIQSDIVASQLEQPRLLLDRKNFVRLRLGGQKDRDHSAARPEVGDDAAPFHLDEICEHDRVGGEAIGLAVLFEPQPGALKIVDPFHTSIIPYAQLRKQNISMHAL